jgi:hypothetical protein
MYIYEARTTAQTAKPWEGRLTRETRQLQKRVKLRKTRRRSQKKIKKKFKANKKISERINRSRLAGIEPARCRV